MFTVSKKLSKPIFNASLHARAHASSASTMSTTSMSLSGCAFVNTLLKAPNQTQTKRTYAVNPLTMPALSPTMTMGTITKWHVEPGQKVSAGEVLCSVQTDKAIVEMDTQEDLILGKILMEEGSEDVKLGEVIALVCDSEKDLKDVDSYKVEGKVETSDESDVSTSGVVLGRTSHSSTTASSLEIAPTQDKKKSLPFLYMDPPSVRIFLETYNIDRSQISTASGKNGRISKEDIIQFQTTDAFKQAAQQRNAKKAEKSASTSKSTSPTPQAQVGRPRPPKYEDINASLTRKIIASRLLESKQQLPHFYMSTEAKIDKLMAYREHLKSKGVKVSLNDMIIKLSGRALEAVPQCNAIFNAKTGEHEIQDSIDISVAVATEGGLITPIVKNANRKTVDNISSEVKALASRARSGGLKPEEFQGGSFCISNLGMFGIKNFEAVINPPQALILAVGGSEKRTYLETQDEANDKFGFNQSFDLSLLDEVDPNQLNNGADIPKTATYLTLTVSADARAVDGKDVGEFLSVLKDLLEMRTAM